MVSKLLNVTASAALLAVTSLPLAAARAADPVLPVSSSSFAMTSTAALVDRFHADRKDAPLWLRDAAATDQLLTLLRTSAIDGFAAGPALAAEADALVARARSGDSAAAKAAERLLSSAWLSYVEVLYSPVPGVIYGDPWVRPKVPPPAYSLQQLARAPSLAAAVNDIARLNPIRAQLREAALREAALPGGGQSAVLAANLDRARLLPATGRFVMVDVPSARLWMYEDGKPVDSMKVIVGMNDYRTPMIASVIYYATLNPYWHVPDHLVRKTVAPGVIKGGAAYLKTRNYEIVDRWALDAAILPPETVDWPGVLAGRVQVKVRQKPGGANSMGKMKVPFPNGEGIYLHDTPSKQYFAQADRAISNGCIRLEDATRFGRWLFGSELVTTSTAPEQYVQMPRGVPVYVTYLTALPERATIAYSKDVYGLDRVAGSRIVSAK